MNRGGRIIRKWFAMYASHLQKRKEFKAGDDVRDAGLTTPDDIRRYDDILYGEDTGWQLLDVYRPKEADGTHPKAAGHRKRTWRRMGIWR